MEQNKEKKIENEENIKKGFFKKVWYSIDKVEKYSELSAEGFGKAFKYLIILVIMISIVSSGVSTFRMYKQIKQIGKYINENAPEFTYSDEILKVNSEEPIINEGNEFGKVIIDTSDISEETQAEYLNNIKEDEDGIVILKDKLIMKSAGIKENTTYTYSQLFAELNITEFNKESLVEYLSGSGMISVYLNLFLVLLIYAFALQFINAIFYVIIVSIFGYLTSIVLRLRMRYIAVLNMAIYSITLPTILYIIYLAINAFVNYTIGYFDVMYMLVATIYIIAALFILKTEFNKKQSEVQKVIEVEKEVKEEIKQEQEEQKQKEEKEENKDTNKKEEEDKEKQKNKKDKNSGEEPEGSNA